MLLPSSAAYSAIDRTGEPRVVIVLMDGVSVFDLTQETSGRAMAGLIRDGSVGLMSSRSLGRSKEADYLTLGAGERALIPLLPSSDVVVGSAQQVDRSNEADPAAVSYRARTGRSPSVVVQPFAQAIAEANALGVRGARVGVLGDALRDKGGVYVVGANDLPRGRRAPGVALAMDAQGRVSDGELGDLREVGRERLNGILRKAFASAAPLVIIDPGGLYGLSIEATLFDKSQALATRREGLGRVDDIVDIASRNLDFSRDTLVVTSVSRPDGSEPFQTLVPTIIKGPGFSAGLLTSTSTRRIGVISSLDLAPTVLDALHIDRTDRGIVGSPAASMAKGTGASRLSLLQSEQQRFEAADMMRKPALYFLVAAASALFFIASLVLLVNGISARRTGSVSETQVNGLRWAAIPSVAICAILVAMYSAPLLWHGDGLQIVASVLLGALALAAGSLAVGRWSGMPPIAVLGIVSIVVVVIDLLSGGYVGSSSVLGYSISAGSRYYGIGNEVMGLLLVAATLSGAALADAAVRRGQHLAIYLLAIPNIAALVLIAVPVWGANLGGTIALAVAAASTLALYLLAGRENERATGTGPDQERPRRRLALVALAVASTVVISVATLLVVDALSGQSSHAGRAGVSILNDGPSGVIKIAARKLELNLRLLRVSPWAQVIASASVMMLVVYVFFGKELRSRLRSRPGMRAAIPGSALGIVAALVFNDSGVVAAGVALVFGGSAMIYLLASVGAADAATPSIGSASRPE